MMKVCETKMKNITYMKSLGKVGDRYVKHMATGAAAGEKAPSVAQPQPS